MSMPSNCFYCVHYDAGFLSEPGNCTHPERAIDAYSPVVHKNAPPAWCPLRPDAVPYDGSVNYAEDHPSHPKWRGRYGEWMEVHKS